MTGSSEERELLRASLRGLLRDSGGTWKALAEAGFTAIAVGESGDVRSLVVAAEETGRSLTPAPFLAGACVAAPLARALPPSEASASLLAALQAGSAAVLAIPAGTAFWDPAVASAEIAKDGRITGSVPRVLNGCEADLLIVPAYAPGDGTPRLVLVEAAEVATEPLAGADTSRPLATVRLDRAPGAVLAAGDHARAAVRRALLTGTLCAAAEMIGVAQSALDTALGYVRQRVAFGRPIGSFQAVKHACVELYAEIVQARVLLDTAVDATGAEREIAAAQAKIQAGHAQYQAATRSILLHGAIGFTWEHGGHRLVRRALSDRTLLGTSDLHRRRTARALAATGHRPGVVVPGAAADWIAEHAPAFRGDRDGVGHFAVLTAEEASDQVARARAWERHKAEAGWSGVAVPKEYGGQGGTPYESAVFMLAERRHELPHIVFAITHGMVRPTLLTWGTHEQKRRHVPRMLDGSELWCQLFSEPGAGSDLAMLATRAVRTERGWRIDGQKVWTSGAQHSDFGLLLARTDPEQPRHRGLSAFIVPMNAPGITVRPITQATGSASFCEVFFDAVDLPGDALLGEAGQGWRVAVTTLMNERFALTGDGVPLDRVFAEAHAREAFSDPDLAPRLADLHALWQCLERLTHKALEELRTGRQPGPEGSVNKLLTGRAAARAAETAADLLGEDLQMRPEWNEYVLGSTGLRIGGGTEEIQLNVLAERVLGLPKDHRDDDDVPWSRLRRG